MLPPPHTYCPVCVSALHPVWRGLRGNTAFQDAAALDTLLGEYDDDLDKVLPATVDRASADRVEFRLLGRPVGSPVSRWLGQSIIRRASPSDGRWFCLSVGR